jgi:GNAT superfamily N-acetyltransferase
LTEYLIEKFSEQADKVKTMSNIIIRKAAQNEIEWVNSKYEEINFQASDFEKEYIAVAEIDRQRCGLGRLIKFADGSFELGGMYVFEDYRGLGIAEKIVLHLLNQTKESDKIWCLPFNHLLNFYGRFGFKPYENEAEIPSEIICKHKWCNQSYSHEVPILVR